MGVRGALAAGLERFGRALWRGPLPQWLRVRLIAWIMKRAPQGPVTRRLAGGVAAGGGKSVV